VLGDPTEYTLVANVLGIAHPPGYAFITLAGKLFQTLIPFGEHPLAHAPAGGHGGDAACCGALSGAASAPPRAGRRGARVGSLAGLFAALSVAFAADVWQHAIHANPHILSADFPQPTCIC
jgi:hypothetical protein